MDDIIRKILRDIQVDLKDEFDQNFERQAFFSKKWQRRKSPGRDANRAILTDSGHLRGSIQSRISGNSIVFFSNAPYAAIHNEGGEIVVTERMKRFFRYKFYQAQKMKKRGDGNSRHRPLTDGGFAAWTEKMTMESAEAEFWRFMALKKAGTTIKIPRRRFLGKSPEVEKAVRAIIEKHLRDYIGKTIDFKMNEKK